MKISFNKARIFTHDGITNIIEITHEELIENLHRTVILDIDEKGVLTFTSEKVNCERFVKETSWERHYHDKLTTNKEYFDKVKPNYIVKKQKVRRKFNWKKFSFEKTLECVESIKEGRVEMKDRFVRKRVVCTNYYISNKLT